MRIVVFHKNYKSMYKSSSNVMVLLSVLCFQSHAYKNNEKKTITQTSNLFPIDDILFSQKRLDPLENPELFTKKVRGFSLRNVQNHMLDPPESAFGRHRINRPSHYAFNMNDPMYKRASTENTNKKKKEIGENKRYMDKYFEHFHTYLNVGNKKDIKTHKNLTLPLQIITSDVDLANLNNSKSVDIETDDNDFDLSKALNNLVLGASMIGNSTEYSSIDYFEKFPDQHNTKYIQHNTKATVYNDSKNVKNFTLTHHDISVRNLTKYNLKIIGLPIVPIHYGRVQPKNQMENIQNFKQTTEYPVINKAKKDTKINLDDTEGQKTKNETNKNINDTEHDKDRNSTGLNTYQQLLKLSIIKHNTQLDKYNHTLIDRLVDIIIDSNITSSQNATEDIIPETIPLEHEAWNWNVYPDWNDYSYMGLYIHEPSRLHCDAAAVSPHWLIASAACLRRHTINYSDLVIRSAFVAYCGTEWVNPVRVTYVRYTLIHPYFNQQDPAKTYNYNIGLIRVENSMDRACNKWMSIEIMSYKFSGDKSGVSAHAIGWGLDRFGTSYASKDLPQWPLLLYEGRVFSQSCPGNMGYQKLQHIQEVASNIYCLSLPKYLGEHTDPTHGTFLLFRGKLFAIYLNEERRSSGKQSAVYTGIWKLIPWITETAKEPEESEHITIM